MTIKVRGNRPDYGDESSVEQMWERHSMIWEINLSRIRSSQERYDRPSQLFFSLASLPPLHSFHVLRSDPHRVTWNYNSVKLTLHMLITENRSMPRSHLQGSPFSRRNVHIYVRELWCTTHVHPCASKWRTVAFDHVNDAKFLWNSASFSESKDFGY